MCWSTYRAVPELGGERETAPPVEAKCPLIPKTRLAFEVRDNWSERLSAVRQVAADFSQCQR